MDKTVTFLSHRSLHRKQISLGNQDNLTTINTLSEGKITFCCYTDHIQMTDFSFKFKHRRAVYIYIQHLTLLLKSCGVVAKGLSECFLAGSTG